MRPTRVHLHPRQERQLAKRAKITGKSVSEEMRNAIDSYLHLPVTDKEGLRALLEVGGQSANRILRRLDEAISYVNRVLRDNRRGRKRRVPLVTAN